MLLLSTTLTALSLLQDPVSSIDWRGDLDAARAEARATGRPLMAVFRCEP